MKELPKEENEEEDVEKLDTSLRAEDQYVINSSFVEEEQVGVVTEDNK